MTHRFPIKELARQAGLGTATVDRVLNNRQNVSPQTRNRVAAAHRELEAQEKMLTERGRRLFLDVVVEAPKRFSAEIHRAVEAVLPTLVGAAIRARFTTQEIMTEADVIATLTRIQKRGSQGVCLKARDTARIREMVAKLAKAGIPVYTFVTDLPASTREAYIGLDNSNAGRVAAYLMARCLPHDNGTILTTRSQETFFGEKERMEAFREVFEALKPGYSFVDVSGGAGLRNGTIKGLEDTLRAVDQISGVYSMGGGNATILEVLADHGHRRTVFIAHDLDRENRQLLHDHKIDFVLHHDLCTDIRALCSELAAFHGLAQKSDDTLGTDVQVITPYNFAYKKI